MRRILVRQMKRREQKSGDASDERHWLVAMLLKIRFGVYGMGRVE